MASSLKVTGPELNSPEQKFESNIVIIDEEAMGENDSPIEEVRLTVPITDDPSQPVLTFRTWFLGMSSCVVLAFVNIFFGYRSNPLMVSSVVAQIVTLPLGKLMATILPTRKFRLPGTNWSGSLNPGPFNMKEHVLITIFANTGAGGAYATSIITIVKAFYHRNLNPTAAMLLLQTTQLLGYGWAGMFRKFLVDSPYMWWPSNLVQVSLFRALHEKEEKCEGKQTRLRFFLIVFFLSFVYYIIPGYLFPSISSLSFLCWIWTRSVTAQQIGSGLKGLGIGSFGLDWSVVAGFLGSPLAVPFFAIANFFAGFFIFLYIVLPIFYWSNAYDAKKFPLFTSTPFDHTGQKFNTTRILNQKTFDINLAAYESYSKLYVSVVFALVYGLSFGTLTATVSHVALFDGKFIWGMLKKSSTKAGGDVHTRLMKKNYKEVPQWWFISVLFLSFVLALYACEGFGKQLQLPWWGLLLACAVAFTFTLPIGVIQATTNQQIGLNVITELIIGYLYPGKPLANVAFKTYGYVSMSQALSFVGDFKLGHYMKIPPRSMFLVQLVATVVSATVCFGTTWWLLSSVDNICVPEKLPTGSPWTCPGDHLFYSASIIWGIIGPGRMFTSKGVYPGLNWFFLIGFLAPVPAWFLARKFPEKKWIKQIHVPLIFSAASAMPNAKAVNYWSWVIVGVVFNYYIFRRYKGWWARHNYILSAGLDAGTAIMGVLIYFALQNNNISFPGWWGSENTDHCPLALCPTERGIVVKDCPVF
ncbi:Oligopeptide transporter 5 [Raphanus sativus]|uniref:Oligopeptide transporter 5 n=1 Tax=Raphanus sativus TaxID=3726 RepID=A0A9W3DGY5_RAPSA|nr:oligopeptide transporter 5 [Raphanus sativus]KAJ4899434.1 Oligopeptide transporter 5 [Raphanus sativus]